MTDTPAGYAVRIGKILQATLGGGAYPVQVAKVIEELAPVFAPGIALSVRDDDLDSLDGALIGSSDGKRYTILLNSRVLSPGRRNFTLAHELGHFLCHRRSGGKRSCGEKQLTSSFMGDPESEANTFASLLLLPRTHVRRAASTPFTFDSVASFAGSMGVSIAAAALAIVESTSDRALGFAVIIDGFIEWGRASEKAYKAGLFFKSGEEVPSSSVCAFEGLPRQRLETSGNRVLGWGRDDGFIESAQYLIHVKRSYLFLSDGR